MKQIKVYSFFGIVPFAFIVFITNTLLFSKWLKTKRVQDSALDQFTFLPY